ncbi:MAG: GNAT family N-acetyltransferase [Bacteroidetes bacterium]|jgi:predicted GNAT family N-acyltransferase|nr:GNAT family N-acetyltransferase [Bacteroidota bacterium]
MFEIVKFKIEDKDKASIVFDIRQRVFVDEQKVSREEEYDEYEDQSMHYMLLVEKQPAGTARWRFTNDGVKLERFAILPQFRNNGAGSALVKAVLSDVLPHQKMIYLNAQVPAMNLYKRAGFVAEGELFYEANIPHYKMIYKGK